MRSMSLAYILNVSILREYRCSILRISKYRFPNRSQSWNDYDESWILVRRVACFSRLFLFNSEFRVQQIIKRVLQSARDNENNRVQSLLHASVVISVSTLYLRALNRSKSSHIARYCVLTE